jgi:hypothetical protein
MTKRSLELQLTDAEARLLQRRADMELATAAEWSRRVLVTIAAGVADVMVNPTHTDNHLEFPKS